ncbi:hypothetical protein Hanom_Chr14g01301091 [Helianthus anomalus]
MRDRLADSRFDIIRLLFRSSIRSTTTGHPSSEPELELLVLGVESSEPENDRTPKGFSWDSLSHGKNVVSEKPPSVGAKTDDNIVGI